jgi:hypothetical protein
MINPTDTAYYGLCIVGRVNDSTKRSMLHDALDILRHLHQVSIGVK